MIIDKQSKNRCAIFLFFDKDGIVDDYNIYFLKEVAKNVERTIIVCNGSLSSSGRTKFETITKDILIHGNAGMDVGGYKFGFNYVGFEKLKSYDEVILLNYTSYGPFYPFEEMFQEMAEKDLDFWGITTFHEYPGEPFGETGYGCLPIHLQSYFIVLRQSLVSSIEFQDYWNALELPRLYTDSITKFEAVFTRIFQDKGFKWEPYVDTSDLEGFTYDPLRDYPKQLVVEKKCPIIKRRSFFHDYEEAIGRSYGEATFDIFEYIKEETDYDIDLIWENLLRVQNMADLKKRMQLHHVLPANVYSEDIEIKSKVALIMHIYYVELAEECLKYAKSIPENTDVYITVPNDQKKHEIEHIFSKLACNRLEVRVVENRGRDVSALLVGCKDIISKYDIVCFAHDKKVTQIQPQSIGKSWSYRCFENLLGSKQYVYNTLRLFEKNDRLGLLTLTPPNHSEYYPALGGFEWGYNFENCQKLATELKLKVDMDWRKEPIAPFGSFFWFKPKALKTLFEYNWTYEDFPEEPLALDTTISHAIERIYPFVAQHEGYYTASILSNRFARIELTNLRSTNHALKNEMFQKCGYSSFERMLNKIALYKGENE